jgi:hypothetical protein
MASASTSSNAAVGGHDFRAEQLVDRQAVLAHEVADPAGRA